MLAGVGRDKVSGVAGVGAVAFRPATGDAGSVSIDATGTLAVINGATITADGFEGSARARLYKILPQVQKQSTFAGTPGENMDQRVYEVKLRLHPTPKEKPRLRFASNLQVNVVFDATPPAPPAAARP